MQGGRAAEEWTRPICRAAATAVLLRSDLLRSDLALVDVGEPCLPGGLGSVREEVADPGQPLVADHAELPDARRRSLFFGGGDPAEGRVAGQVLGVDPLPKLVVPAPDPGDEEGVGRADM